MSPVPCVSVLMAVYNGELYLAAAIESILKQTFTNFEFIIVDDGSTDRTASILAEYACLDSRICVITQSVNAGLTPSLNLALAKSRGIFIARQDADDLSDPHRLARQVAYLQANNQVGLVGTAAYLIDENSEVLRLFVVPTRSNVIRWSMHLNNVLIHTSVLARRAIIEAVGAYDANQLHIEDYDLWWRISSWAELANLPEPLVMYRLQPDSISHRYKSVQKQMTIQLMKAVISNLFGRPISDEDVMLLYQAVWREQFCHPGEIIRVLNIMWKMYQAYTAQNHLTPLEKKLIKLDLTERIAYVGLDNLKVFPFTSLRILFWATTCMPQWLSSARTLTRLNYVLKKRFMALLVAGY